MRKGTPPLISEYICHYCHLSPHVFPQEDTEVLPHTFQHTLSPSVGSYVAVECPRGQVQGVWPPSSRRPWLVAWLGSHSLPCGWVEALGRVWCQSRAAVRVAGGQANLLSPPVSSRGPTGTVCKAVALLPLAPLLGHNLLLNLSPTKIPAGSQLSPVFLPNGVPHAPALLAPQGV